MRLSYEVGLFLILTSCSSVIPPKWVDSGIGQQPIKNEYRLARKSFEWDSRVDTSSVYMSIGRWSVNGNPEMKTLYRFVRFSNDGVMFLSGIYDKQPNINDFNLMLPGSYSVYAINENMMTVEIYNPLLKRFDLWYGQIAADEISFYKYRGRAWGTSKGELTQMLFRKVDVFLRTKPVFPR